MNTKSSMIDKPWFILAAEVGAILAGIYVVIQATLLGIAIYGAAQKTTAIEQYLIQKERAALAQQAPSGSPEVQAKTKK